MSNRATLHEVAKLAGVSLASTSRALHGSGASPAMVAKVQTAADELGYRPNAAGRTLRMKKTFQIEFAVAGDACRSATRMASGGGCGNSAGAS